MGVGPPILALYRQLKALGAFDGIDSVVELGSQGVWCSDPRLLAGLFEAFGRPVPPISELDSYINNTGTGLAPSRRLHEQLGFKYDCVDIDGNFGSLTLDLNFDQVPPDRRGKYGLTTNHGTSEHLTLNAKTTHLLVVLQRKLHDAEFCVPIQGVYEPMLPASATERYQFVVDGEYYSGRRMHQMQTENKDVSLQDIPAAEIAKHLGRRIVRKVRRNLRLAS
jgi:hypothetical protein